VALHRIDHYLPLFVSDIAHLRMFWGCLASIDIVCTNCQWHQIIGGGVIKRFYFILLVVLFDWSLTQKNTHYVNPSKIQDYIIFPFV
jgi:hypothetical protein